MEVMLAASKRQPEKLKEVGFSMGRKNGSEMPPSLTTLSFGLETKKNKARFKDSLLKRGQKA